MRRRLFVQRSLESSLVIGAGLARASLAAGQPADRSSDGADEGSERDRNVMRELVTSTRRSFTTAHPIPFGALVVRTTTGEAVGRALNEVRPLLEPTAHAEVQAIRAACRQLKRIGLGGCTLYTTAEPCPMCMGAILWAGLDRVVYGATIADIAKHVAQIHVAACELVRHSNNPCEVTGRVERALCNALFEDPVLTPVYRLWRKRT